MFRHRRPRGRLLSPRRLPLPDDRNATKGLARSGVARTIPMADDALAGVVPNRRRG
jgi:hypothetical protein